MKVAILRAMALALMTAATSPAHAAAVQATQAEDPSQFAGQRLLQLDSMEARTLGRAILRNRWEERRLDGGWRFHDQDAIDPLIVALRDRGPVVRRLAAWGLSELRAEQAEPELARLLSGQDAAVRAEAARALGDIGAYSRAAAISRLLSDPESYVRFQAAHALGDLQHPATRPVLEQARLDPSRAVRAKASWALRRVAEAERILRRAQRR